MIGVAIMGYGVVGSGAAKMLIENRACVERAVGGEVRLTHVLDIRDVQGPQGVAVTNRFEDIVTDARVRIVVETIGGTGAALDFTRRALAAGKSVVTSNKELVAGHGDELVHLAEENGAMYLYEASVGGGIPVLRPMAQCLSGNRILAINGIVNGSTNYLLTSMEKRGVSFSAALGEAKELGYVEGNPAADIEGWDARRKLAILANAAFGARFADDAMIPTQGITAITEGDIRVARAFGGAVKLIAHAECSPDGARWSGWVHPCVVREGHPLYAVNDVFNGIVLRGDCVGDVMFYGRGAGSLPTASAVIGDVIDVAQHLEAPKPRLRFERAPKYALPARMSAQTILHARQDAQTQDALRQAFPGTQLREVAGRVALLTPPAAADDLSAMLRRMAGQGVRIGHALPLLDEA